jgi:hypothetical protein
MSRTTTLAGGLALALASAASAQEAQPQPDMAAVFAAQNKIPDTPGSGPFPALMELDAGLPNYVVYRPADFTKLGQRKLGVFVWGNGACADDGASARLHLSEIASHGYLVIAPGKWRNGPNAKEPPLPPRQPAADGTMPPAPTSAADLTEALGWALAENRRSGSRYEGRIDGAAVAAGGFSCGGVQALEIAGDPRVRTLVIQNSGILPDDAPRIGGMALAKSALRAIHTPVIYIQGGPTDIAYANGMDDFQRIGHVPAVMVNVNGVGHGGTYFEPNGGKAAQVAVAWLEWQLRGDPEAATSFLGDDCGLCADPAVEIERKNLR